MIVSRALSAKRNQKTKFYVNFQHGTIQIHTIHIRSIYTQI